MVQLLEYYSCSLISFFQRGYPPLCSAAKFGHEGCLKRLLEAKAAVDDVQAVSGPVNLTGIVFTSTFDRAKNHHFCKQQNTAMKTA
jgi:hypothetical protein